MLLDQKLLGLIDERARVDGYYVAVRDILKLPDADEAAVKHFAMRRVQNEPASFFDPYLVARSFIRAFEDALAQRNIEVRHVFEIDQYVRSGPPLPTPEET